MLRKKDGTVVNCHVCSANHYANNCPKKGSDAPAFNTRGAARAASGSASSSTPSSTSGSSSVSSKDVDVKAIASEAVFCPAGVKKDVFVTIGDSGLFVRALVDTGSQVTVVDKALAEQLKLAITPAPEGSVVHLAEATQSSARIGTVVSDVQIIFPETSMTTASFSGIELEIFAVRSPHADYDVILGNDLILRIFPEAVPSCLLRGGALRQQSSSHVRVMLTSVEDDFSQASPLTDSAVDEPKKAQLSTAAHLELSYSTHRTALLNSLSSDIERNAAVKGFCSLPQSEVTLDVDESGLSTLYRAQYKIAQQKKVLADATIMRWLDTGKIEPTAPGCPYNNAMTVVPKAFDENGALSAVRPCLDSRPINKILRNADAYHIPHIRDSLELLAGCSIFGSVDAQDAFLQLRVNPVSRPLLAFTWGMQQYQFVGAPFGLNFLTAHFQRVMTSVFSNMPFVLVYVDNIIFGSRDWTEHELHARAVINRLTAVNFLIKPSSILLGHSQLAVLGHIVTIQGVAVDPEKIQTIRDWPRPETSKALQSFLGLCGFLRQHIRHYADISAPLEAAKNMSPLEWTSSMIDSFATVKSAFAKACVLAHPDHSRPFHLATDASWTGVGGVLFQPSTDSEHITASNIVAICSKKLSMCQRRWSVYRKELYGIVYSLRQFHTFVYGRTDLVVYTDHKPLTYMFESKELSPALQQWLDLLLTYTFRIVHRDGILNELPDALSRMYGEAYEQSAVWGVEPRFTTAPLPDTSSSVSIRAAALSGGEEEAPNPSLAADEDEEDSDSSASITITSARLAAELERRGKRVPATLDERCTLIAGEHALGHFGVEAIFRQLYTKGWWWPKMRDEIGEQLKACDACARFTVVKAGFHPAQAITALCPADHIQIDTSVHLPQSPDGYTTLLVCIDVFTGFVILRAMKNSQAETVAAELWSIFALIGLPKILQSDNGSEFANDVLRTMVKLTGIEHRFISPYNPRADGKVEKAVGTCSMIIKKMLNGTSHHWPLFVDFAQLSFNNKIASLTGSSPFALMFGRTLNPLRDYSSVDGGFMPVDLSDWQAHQEKIASLIYPALSERVRHSKDKMLQLLNGKRRTLLPSSIPEGSVVMLRDPHRQNKFEPKYIGPYTPWYAAPATAHTC